MALDFLNSSARGLQSDELKKRLIASIKSQQDIFLQKAEAFYGQDIRTRESYLQFAQAIVKAVDEILAAENWEESLFARNCVRPLKEIRDQAQKIIEMERMKGDVKRPSFIQNNKKVVFQKVYIALFQSRAYELKQWELQLRSIESHLVGRPVYREENEVQAAIRLKNAPDQEAYIEVEVPENKIFSDSRVDRFGHALLNLNQGAVKPENIRRFVHAGKNYDFIDGRITQVNITREI